MIWNIISNDSFNVDIYYGRGFILCDFGIKIRGNCFVVENFIVIKR